MQVKLIPKLANEVSLNRCVTSAFIDSSGSTGTTYHKIVHGNSAYVSVFDMEKQFVNSFTHTPIVYWCDHVSLDQNTQATGGTYPQQIFTNPTSAELFKKSQIVLFTTDGEISDGDVTQFAGHLNNNLAKSLFICTIFGKSVQNVSGLNISVIAPFMNAPNVLCLYYDCATNDMYVISSKGSVTQKFPNPEDREVSKLQLVTIRDIHELNVNMINLPQDCFVLSEDEHNYRTVETQNLFNYDYTQFADQELSEIIRYCTINNKLDDLRLVINRASNDEVIKLREELATSYPFNFRNIRDKIVGAMIEAQSCGNIEKQKEFKTMYDEVNSSAKKEEIEFYDSIKNKLNPIKRKWENVKQQLFSIENSTNKYSLNNFASNRAKRASAIVENDEIENVISHEGAPEIECMIHLDKGPAVLWLNETSEVEQSTGDFCINFPLANYPKLCSCIIANPVCGDCASSYFRVRKESVFHEKISGYIPINWDNKTNIHFATNTICKSLCGNKFLPHSKMLMMSIVDDVNPEWFTFKDYMIKNMLNNIITTDTLSETGNKCKLIEVIPKIFSNQENLLRQPFSAIMRLLKWYLKYIDNPVQELVINTIRTCFAYLLIDTYCRKVLAKSNNDANDEIMSILFETICKIPIQYRNNIIDIRSDKIKKFIGNDFYCPMIESVCKIINKDVNDVVNNNVVSNVLWHLANQTDHKRPFALYSDLITKSKIFRELDVKDIQEIINNTKFKKYKGDFDYIPPYASYNGVNSCPSKLFFFDQPLWTKEIEGTSIKFSTLCNVLRDALQKKMIEKYGSNYPNSYSGHIMGHKYAAQVLDEKYKGVNEYKKEMFLDVLAIMKETNGNYGNIYNIKNMCSTYDVILDFIELRRNATNKPSNAEYSKTFECKLLGELNKYGITVGSDNMLTFDVSKIIPPQVKVVRPLEQYIPIFNALNDVEIIKPLGEEPNDQVIRENFDDHFEFGDKNIKIEEYLVRWNEEQKEILKHLEIKPLDHTKIKYIGGMDITFDKNNEENCVACLVIHEYDTMKLVGVFTMKGVVRLPYVANYLAFRESPLLMKLLDNVRRYSPYNIDVLIIDGNGSWHPRGCGIATHLSILTGIPAIGVAKNVLFVENITRTNVEETVVKNAQNKGDSCEIITESGKILGMAYNITSVAKNCVYVSVGNYIDLPSSMEIVKHMSKFRNNESIRQADLISRSIVYKNIFN
jgi:deoxyinosine 3'endonuclease (endonuclease V)